MSIRIISWNINGIRAAVKRGLVDFIKKDKADIYCLQEVKASQNQIDLHLKEYTGYWNSAKKAGYSGVLTLSKLEPKAVIIGDRDNDWDDEGRVIITKFDKFTLLNVYFPNGKKDRGRLMYKLEFYEYFLQYINKLRDQGEKIVFCGDVNTAHREIDLARPKENENISGFLEIERKWLDKLEQNGYIDTYRWLHPQEIGYSWWSPRSGARKRNIGWRIDYFFVSDNLKNQIKKAFILPEVQGSDHCPIGVELSL
ncbi:MAG TPA: exodeoxyribonuclease III [Candidatus Woesebacteria bacterium]|nr:exodeoxyribonuclease III [Candidatus Woesebacteria bacterium]